MKRLTIRNIHILGSYFPPSVWYYSGWLERDDCYEFILHRNGNGMKKTFVLKRNPNINDDDEIYYITYVRENINISSNGQISHSFITNPKNLAVHIMASIGIN